jgi:hypothetical protein
MMIQNIDALSGKVNALAVLICFFMALYANNRAEGRPWRGRLGLAVLKNKGKPDGHRDSLI